ncbi:MAG: 50S ribosomal protein L11 methyltransferase [Ruminococcaceae bacterium]|nr:50S ribosomal protein L11 methyltransferase [Oscillospiraceae bacterium]
MTDNWTELTVSVPVTDTDRAADIANMTVPYGLYIEDYSDLEQGAREIAHIDLIDEELLARDRTRSLIHVYLEPEVNPAEALAFLQERLSAAGIDNALSTRTVRESDWANNWKQFFKPLPVGEKLLILPTWETDENKDGRAVLHIDPGMAFGTGGHETTRLVLETLEKTVKEGDRFLDIGCGSGILSIAALLLGAACAFGVDIDPLAVKTARENGALNDMVAPRYEIVEGDLADKVTGQYEVVAANIVADAIIALSPAVPAFLKEGGVYVVSGIIDVREAEVTEALGRCGFTVAERYEQRGWVCLVCKR